MYDPKRLAMRILCIGIASLIITDDGKCAACFRSSAWAGK